MMDYQIPDYIKEDIDKRFLLIFGNNLLDSFGDKYSLKEIIDNEVGTTGWDIAFARACDSTLNGFIIDYYHSLECEESELFDSELSEMFYQNNIINKKGE